MYELDLHVPKRFSLRKHQVTGHDLAKAAAKVDHSSFVDKDGTSDVDRRGAPHVALQVRGTSRERLYASQLQ